jgi:mutator protein MutT
VTRFPCPRCRTLLTRVKPRASTGRSHPLEIRCPRCRFLMFDYPRACAGMIVMKRDQVLVLRRAHHPRKGWLDTPGGFIDAGEGIETAARRELREETGLEAGEIEPLLVVVHDYADRGLRLHCFLAREPAGEVRIDGDREWGWVRPAEIDAAAMPAANASILRALATRLGS